MTTDARKTLTETEYRLLKTLAERGPTDFSDLVAALALDQSVVAAAALTLEQQGLLLQDARERTELTAGPAAADIIAKGWPERRAAAWLAARGGAAAIDDAIAWTKANGLSIGDVIKWGEERGWLDVERAPDPRKPNQLKAVALTLTSEGAAAHGAAPPDERALAAASQGRVFLDEIGGGDAVQAMLRARPAAAKLKKRTQRSVALTDAGRAMAATASVHEERTALTSAELRSGAWRTIALRAYDVTLPARTVRPAKPHPLRRIMEQVRRTFLDMGFTEVVSPIVESAFWNFDALYQPQDHPARDMQDTFYMSEPDRVALPSADLVARVSRTHETGGDTGSQGWGYRWSPEEARRVVLRTHTTAATIRAVARHPAPPLKAFCVGWTCRNETITFKHLPVFHQVDGIIIDRDASLASLMGTLREFYRKMGFDRVKFKPAFYPYTEPSMDVIVYMESRSRWIEMGGSGVFRPEVTVPLGCDSPVLAWGLGIERLAMLRYGFTDLRDLYRSSLDALEETPLCR